jgi:hypothetical protein
MATSGTQSFDLDISEVIQEAIENSGGQPTLGEEARSARRSLNLLMIDWQNRGIPLWKVDMQTQLTTSGDNTYTTPTGTIDILEMVLRRDDIDTGMRRISFQEYLLLPNKQTEGRPLQYYVDRQRALPTFTTYFVPENDTDTLVYWRFARIEDVTAQYQQADVPFRFLPPLTTGLAWMLAEKRKNIDPNKILRLKENYQENLGAAIREDSERATFRLVPREQVL